MNSEIKKKEKKNTAARASVVFCNWNGGADIVKALNSVDKQTYKNIETIVVDNGSSDGSPGLIQREFKNVRLIRSRTNLGFAGGNNLGISHATGDIIFTINQDVVLTPDFIEKIMRFYESCPGSVGMIGGKILRMDGKTIDSAGLKLSRSRRFYDRGSGEEDRGRFDNTTEVFGICAAAAAYRKSMLDKIRTKRHAIYFDERFYLLVEDVDLAWRAKHAGYEALYYPEAVCYHVRGGAGWKNKNKQYLSFRNRYFMLIKNEYLVNYFWAFPWFLCYDCPRFFYLILSNKLVWKALREIAKEFPSLIRERKTLLKNSKMKPSEARRWMRSPSLKRLV